MKRIVITSAVIAAIACGAALAQQQTSSYKPGLADFMMFTQFRHAKLWLAGNAGNWELADYQLDELKEGLEDAAKYVPDYKGTPVGKMIESIIAAPIEDLEKAVKAKDRVKFASAYDKLTAACNQCHQSANRPYIVIQRPANSAFPNQSFATPRQ